MKFRMIKPKKMLKYIDRAIVGSILGISLVAGKLGYVSYRTSFTFLFSYSKLAARESHLDDIIKELSSENSCLQPRYNEDHKKRSQQIMSEMIRIEGLKAEDYVSQSATFATVVEFFMYSAIDRENEILIVGGWIFLMEFISRKVLDNYHYQEEDSERQNRLRNCNSLKNNLLITYFSFLSAVTVVAPVLVANIFLQNYEQRIADLVSPIPIVGRLCFIVTDPLIYEGIFQAVIGKVLDHCDYTREVQI